MPTVWVIDLRGVQFMGGDQARVELYLKTNGIRAIDDHSLSQYRNHSRDWQQNHYVYPVISRRSGGLSIGINLNPDMACNFDCVYCQVDRSATPRVRKVEPDRLGEELATMIVAAQSGALFESPGFSGVPEALRTIKDFAFSGDGEPTTCKQLHHCLELTASLRNEYALKETRIVLITDACYLTKPDVAAALTLLDENNGEIWAKLDAGTESYFQQVNRPNFSLQHVIYNIAATASVRPVVIQSLFARLNDEGPGEEELEAYVQRLQEIVERGGEISTVQVYTVARRPAEGFVSSLSDDEVDAIVSLVKDRTELSASPFYGTSA